MSLLLSARAEDQVSEKESVRGLVLPPFQPLCCLSHAPMLIRAQRLKHATYAVPAFEFAWSGLGLVGLCGRPHRWQRCPTPRKFVDRGSARGPCTPAIIGYAWRYLSLSRKNSWAWRLLPTTTTGQYRGKYPPTPFFLKSQPTPPQFDLMGPFFFYRGFHHRDFLLHLRPAR